MYFNGYSVDDNQRFVEEAGFKVRTATVETIHEDGRPVTFLWVVAQSRSLHRQESVALFRKIDSVQIPVPDLEVGLAFYRDQLGHELIWRTSTSAGLRMPDTDAELVLQTQREQWRPTCWWRPLTTLSRRSDARGGQVRWRPSTFRSADARSCARSVGNVLCCWTGRRDR
jgi:catechol 2,3-dioxygenase-like lactoylglutathione lyase family enzyme